MRGARGGFDQNRTLDESPRPTASRTQRKPRKKNTPCFLDLAGVKFLLKKERVFFFRGVLPSITRAVWWGEMRGSRAKMEGFKGRKFLPVRFGVNKVDKTCLPSTPVSRFQCKNRPKTNGDKHQDMQKCINREN